jgi:hypothetical protein
LNFWLVQHREDQWETGKAQLPAVVKINDHPTIEMNSNHSRVEEAKKNENNFVFDVMGRPKCILNKTELNFNRDLTGNWK